VSRSPASSTALLALAALCLLGLALSPVPPAGADPVESGKTKLILNPALYRALEAEGVRVVGLRPAKVDRRVVTMPIDEGILEAGHGTGYVFERGGFRFQAERGSLTIRNPILNTAKRRLNATIESKNVVVATTEGIRGRRAEFGIDVKVRSLLLTGKGARVLNRALGLHGVFVAGRSLGEALISIETDTVPIAGGSLEFSFDERFREKLQSLGITVSPFESATQVSAVPLAYSFGEVKGDVNRYLSHGGIATTNDGLRLVQAGAPEPREAIWGSLGIGFENGFGGEASDVVLARWRVPLGISAVGPIGQIEFGSPPFDAKNGRILGGPSFATLSPFAVQPLNDTFAAGKSPSPFYTGEPLGTFSFSVSLR
jgi:hypothetical protein